MKWNRVFFSSFQILSFNISSVCYDTMYECWPFSSSEEQVNLINFSYVSTNPSFKSYGKVGRTGGCHGICFTTRAKGSIEQDVLEKDNEPVEVNVENGKFS